MVASPGVASWERESAEISRIARAQIKCHRPRDACRRRCRTSEFRPGLAKSRLRAYTETAVALSRRTPCRPLASSGPPSARPMPRGHREQVKVRMMISGKQGPDSSMFRTRRADDVSTRTLPPTKRPAGMTDHDIKGRVAGPRFSCCFCGSPLDEGRGP